MAYTTINKSSEHFNTKIYTGNQSSTHAVTGVGFEPSLTWLKIRTGTGDNYLYDAIRGVTKSISSNTTSSEFSNTYFSSFNTDGFTLGSASNNVNGGYNYASWNFKANGAGSANTAGSINSTVSVNTTSGFSIVKYIGNDTSGATVGHGLGVVPKMIIVKRLSGSAQHWQVYHISTGNTKSSQLSGSGTPDTSAAYWNNTSPTNSVFTIGNGSTVNGGGGADSYIAYCFADIQGYSKVSGSYTGNGNADGTFVYTGFKPAFVMLKNTTRAASWLMYDNKRLGYNVDNNELVANASAAEETYDQIDILSNGFKMRANGTSTNLSGDTYIYMAFASAPLVGSNNVPCTAR